MYSVGTFFTFSEPLLQHTFHRGGLIEECGQKKGRTWHLSAAAYRMMGDKTAYVRQRVFEPLQQEQMVLQYVEKHGRITRREAAYVCRIGSYQANRLLTRLVKDGRLDKYGEGKGTWYERAQKIRARAKNDCAN